MLRVSAWGRFVLVAYATLAGLLAFLPGSIGLLLRAAVGAVILAAAFLATAKRFCTRSDCSSGRPLAGLAAIGWFGLKC